MLVCVATLLIFFSRNGIAEQRTCTDHHGQQVGHQLHYIPGPEPCTLCICEDGQPTKCKSVLCQPPKDCRSFRVGLTCCEFICLDDVVKPGAGGAGEAGGGRLAAGGAAALALLAAALVTYRVRRVKRRRAPPADQRSLASIGYISGAGYGGAGGGGALAWKPAADPLPRGEAPPPYDEVMAQCRQELARLPAEALPRPCPAPDAWPRACPAPDAWPRACPAPDPLFRSESHCGHYVNVPAPLIQMSGGECYAALQLPPPPPAGAPPPPAPEPRTPRPTLHAHFTLLSGGGGGGGGGALGGARLTASLGAISGRALLQHHRLARHQPMHRTIPREPPRRESPPHSSPPPRAAPAPAPRCLPAAAPAAPAPRTPAKLPASEAATLPLTVDKPSCECSYECGGDTDDYRRECENCNAANTSKWVVCASSAAGAAGGAGAGSQTLERRASPAPPPAATSTLPQPVTRPRTVLGQPSNWENWFNSIPDSDSDSDDE